MKLKLLFGALTMGVLLMVASCGDDTPPPPPAEVLPFSLPDGFKAKTYKAGLDLPSSLAFSPDGRLFVNELQSGKIKVIDANGTVTEWASVETNVSGGFPSDGENGLIGLAFDNDFETNGYVYVTYGYRTANGTFGRVARFEDVNGKGENFTVLMDNLPNNAGHQITGVQHGPDGKLYVMPSDAFSGDAALIRDMNSVLGKFIRMNPDGSMPSDNPFAGTYFYARGLRNAFDFIFLENGEILMTENGPEKDDEANIIEAGGDYAWPDHTGVTTEPGYINPRYVWGATVSPTGLLQYKGSQFPASYKGKVFQVLFGPTYSFDVSDRAKRIVLMTLTGSGQNTDIAIQDFAVYNKYGEGNPLDITEGPDGSLYFTDIFAGRIYKIYYE